MRQYQLTSTNTNQYQKKKQENHKGKLLMILCW